MWTINTETLQVKCVKLAGLKKCEAFQNILKITRGKH